MEQWGQGKNGEEKSLKTLNSYDFNCFKKISLEEC